MDDAAIAASISFGNDAAAFPGDDAVEAAIAEASDHHAHHPQGPRVDSEPGDLTPVSRLIPWTISLAVHAAVVFAAIFIVWSVRSIASDEEVVIPIITLSQTPGAPVQITVRERVEQTPTAAPAPPAAPAPSPLASEVSVDVDLPSLGTSISSGPSFELDMGDAAQFDANFMGSGGNARNIVFVVDAGGSLVDTMPFIQRELQKSVRKLSEKQKFTVFFATGGGLLEVEPKGMLNASADLKARRLAWLDPMANNVRTYGRSNLVEAIQSALRLRPDLVYLLTADLIGQRQWAIDGEQFLKDVDRLNGGRTKINGLQFIYEDPLDNPQQGQKGFLRRLTEQTGGQYDHIEEADLGLR